MNFLSATNDTPSNDSNKGFMLAKPKSKTNKVGRSNRSNPMPRKRAAINFGGGQMKAPIVDDKSSHSSDNFKLKKATSSPIAFNFAPTNRILKTDDLSQSKKRQNPSKPAILSFKSAPPQHHEETTITTKDIETTKENLAAKENSAMAEQVKIHAESNQQNNEKTNNMISISSHSNKDVICQEESGNPAPKKTGKDTRFFCV